ncbi:phosphate regulon sensor histidine kinase PhoR [Isoalcanivorax beigongshangi]|uniref:Phosphate regulon sensor protein PhoR n=1 Tax=Isoalcanivorax beigongshangi TaxID=3238810 RepID=A0ABV4ADZ5_9GAMM
MNFTVFSEVRRIALVLVIGLLLSWYAHSFWPLALAMIGYVALNLWQIVRFVRWIQRYPEQWEPPESSGAWGELFDAIYRLLRKEMSARDDLQQLIGRAQSSITAHRDAIIVVDRRGRLEFWNRAAERLLGFRAPQDVRQPLTNLIRDPRLVEYLHTGNFDHPMSLPAPSNDNILLEFTITRFGGGEWLVVVRDVTRLHNLEQMRKDFVANVSHELKTPLTVLKGYLETLIDTLPPEQTRMHRALQQMDQQSHRMDALIQDLLLLARLEGTEPDNNYHKIMLAPLLRRLQQDALSLHPEKAQQIVLEVAPDATLLGDHNEIQSAFSNLITNAVKYTPQAGRIDIRWWEDDLGGHFSVLDNGVGIDRQHLPRLTERFYRPDHSRVTHTGGTGLGLSIVKHVLIRHNARLNIESTLGKGSCFTCHFPRWRVGDEERKDVGG